MRRCASDAQKLEQLRRLIREIEYLKYTLNSTLYWDKMTYMPEKGLTYRSEVMSFLGAQLYERFRSPELRSLVDHFSRQKDAPPQVSAMVRRVESNYIYINKIPQAEYQAYIALIAKAEQVWEQAREANDFQRFAPYLERIVDTFRAFAGYWGYEAEPYDALMSFYETLCDRPVSDTAGPWNAMWGTGGRAVSPPAGGTAGPLAICIGDNRI